MTEFLFEIGLEEIPARMIAPAQAELTRRVADLLLRERLLEGGHAVQSFATPRRVAVLLGGVRTKQPDAEERLTGPSWKVAYRDGEPTAAALAFARKAGVEAAALEKAITPKGEYATVTVTRPGRSAAEILGEHLPRELGLIYWAKSMFWRAGKPERFVRPVRWIVALLGEEIVPLQFGGETAGRDTYGHRILHGPAPIAIAKPSQYVPALESAFVTPSVEARRHRIRKALDRATREVTGARWREDEALVETVTQLTEWPSVLLGNFDPEYLALPEEVLVTVMRDHQKYFAVEDAEGRLAPHFLAVLNTQADEQGTALIRHGNERVLRARFNDARFFWQYDQRVPLKQRVELLKSVTFQKDLGSYWKKTELNASVSEALAERVAERGIALDRNALRLAVRLAKADLTAELVKEFTELQGVIGGLYARAQGLGETVAAAIYFQYRPASAEDAVPPTIEGKLLGLADRMTTITEMFALGLEPTGSRDPFALRRAGNAVIRILAEGNVPLRLGELEALAADPMQKTPAGGHATAVRAFLRERLAFYLRDVRSYAYDVVNAVLAAGAEDVPDALARTEALTAVRGSEDFIAISTAFKRIKNILRQAAERGDTYAHAVESAQLREPAERALHTQARALAHEVEHLRGERRYREALERIATLRPAVDAFFDTVMVMVPDDRQRRDRLALVSEVLEDFSRIADFSEIVVDQA